MSHGVGRIRRALDHHYASAATISVGAVTALVWSALSPSTYQGLVNHPLVAGGRLDVHLIVLNGAMTLFFATIGLELSRELGSNPRARFRGSLPALLGALGGMAGTAALSLGLGEILRSSALRRGWGIPMATDIAFTLGVLALAGRRIPTPLRLFLLTLAIADDVLSVVVLSATGVSHVRADGLVTVVAVVAIGWRLRRRVSPTLVFSAVLLVTWLALAWAGVEPALAGVVAGLVTPVTSSSARRVEVVVARLSVGVVLPLFALVACGVTWSSLRLSGATGTIIVATVLVRILGKALGIGAGVALAGILGFRRHVTLTWPIVLGGSLLCAIGFTVPLLFATALYAPASATYGAFTLGLLIASLVGGAIGVATLRRATRPRESH